MAAKTRRWWSLPTALAAPIPTAGAALDGFAGVAQCDGYRVYKSLAEERPELQLAHCWSHCRRKFFKLMKTDGSTPLAEEAVRRIRAFYAIEDDIRGHSAADRQAARQERTAPLVESFRQWLLATKAQTMKGSALEEAVDYALEHWNGLICFLDDGRVEIDSNTVERALRPLCLTRKNSLFAGSDGGAENWAVTASIVETCKMLGVNVQAYITDVLIKIVQGWPNSHLDELMPWAWQPPAHEAKAAA